ncbi:hypothetical protein [Aquimarina rubra]|uniref:Uncharacterized protein n=1 Tax=Aquimarina rubra TaxID=1920033 RepID=A0ABW5LM40_9FLAO
MSNEFEALQSQWQKDKNSFENKSQDIEEVFSLIRKKKSWSTRFHYGNILVLSIVLIGIITFFYFVAPVQELLSRVGVGLMVGGLLVRIIIEMISVFKAKKINMMDSALNTTNDTITFYNFRKTIHGPITLGILGLYTIGFYMITPEFSLYFETWQIVLIDISYIIGAIIPFVAIRKNIKKEIKILSEIIELKKKMTEEAA